MAQFREWLLNETKVGSHRNPLYHAHHNVDLLVQQGFTKDNLDQAGSGIASTPTPLGGRMAYGTGDSIHLTRAKDFAIRFASNKYGPTGGVVEVLFNARKPFFVPESATLNGMTYFRVFVDPEYKRLIPLTNNLEQNVGMIADAISNMQTARKLVSTGDSLGVADGKARKAPIAVQAKILAREFVYGSTGFTRTGWPIQFRNTNPVFGEEHFATLGAFDWAKWAQKGYLDSVWWGQGGGPFHGEEEVSVFDPRMLRVGRIVHRNQNKSLNT